MHINIKLHEHLQPNNKKEKSRKFKTGINYLFKTFVFIAPITCTCDNTKYRIRSVPSNLKFYRSASCYDRLLKLATIPLNADAPACILRVHTCHPCDRWR